MNDYNITVTLEDGSTKTYNVKAINEREAEETVLNLAKKEFGEAYL
jgi:hypothetical protein